MKCAALVIIAYSVSGQAVSELHTFNPAKGSTRSYAKSAFSPPEFGRKLAVEPGSNAGKAPMGFITGHTVDFDWSGEVAPRPESDAIIYELHVKGFTKNPNSGVHPSRADTYSELVDKIPYLQELGVTVVELMSVFQRDPHEGEYWGYMPLNFFSPHAQYASTCDDDRRSSSCNIESPRDPLLSCFELKQTARSGPNRYQHNPTRSLACRLSKKLFDECC